MQKFLHGSGCGDAWCDGARVWCAPSNAPAPSHFRTFAPRTSVREIGICYILFTSTMQAVETTRLQAPGGAAGPPPFVSQGAPPLRLLSPGSGDQSVRRRQAFGRRLHAARHRSGVTLEEIAQTTKISA